eukprot:1037489-Prymnesium_polylepis.1
MTTPVRDAPSIHTLGMRLRARCGRVEGCTARAAAVFAWRPAGRARGAAVRAQRAVCSDGPRRARRAHD